MIGDRSFDIEDARLHNLHASLSAEATQNPGELEALNAEAIITSRTR
jgi:hypothetical protein